MVPSSRETGRLGTAGLSVWQPSVYFWGKDNQQEYPRIDPGIVQKLVAGFELSYTEAITATILVGILLMLITAGLVWFGLRGKADEPLTDVVAGE